MNIMMKLILVDKGINQDDRMGMAKVKAKV